jgi:homoserine O-acetyltransferase/O-succinyltransferase
MKTYLSNEPLLLESGELLSQLKIAYNTYGTLNDSGSNVIWICHAFTASSDVESWWPGMIGPNQVFDPQHHFIVCANILGSCYGTTGPLSLNPETRKPYFGGFPNITVRDMVSAHERLRIYLGINRIALLVGASLGGQQALEWSIQNPSLVKKLVLIATNARHSPWGIAFNEAQRMAISADSSFGKDQEDAGIAGMMAARSIALLSYRSYDSYLLRQEDTDLSKIDGFRASIYQQYQGKKLADRFNAYSYWTLSKAMDSHNIARNRSSVESVLGTIQAQTLVIGIKSDLLFPIEEQQTLALFIPSAAYTVIPSLFGHDGFLIETQAIRRAIQVFIHSKEFVWS